MFLRNDLLGVYLTIDATASTCRRAGDIITHVGLLSQLSALNMHHSQTAHMAGARQQQRQLQL